MTLTICLAAAMALTLAGWAAAVVLFPTRGRHASGEGGSR